MGDYVQIIADVEATEAEAPRLGASVGRWLAGEGIIEAEPTGCVLGARPGYPPGLRYTAAGWWCLCGALPRRSRVTARFARFLPY